jgi:hypothetical protein
MGAGSVAPSKYILGKLMPEQGSSFFVSAFSKQARL